MSIVTDYIEATDGVRLAVYRSGLPGATTVVFVHGYPDNHSVWDGLVTELGDAYDIVTYDVRGAGDSSAPASRSGYEMPQLVADLAAVLNATSPDRPVHLVAHDWGSIQSWAAVVDPCLEGRLLSFTSISGPSMDFSFAWMRENGLRNVPLMLRQMRKSWYINVFQMPRIPELMAGSSTLDNLMAKASARTRSRYSREVAVSRPKADRINGIELYRANMRTLPTGEPRRVPAGVPVQIIAPKGDAYVSADIATVAPRKFVDDLTVKSVAGGHWVVAERPNVIASELRDFFNKQVGQTGRTPAHEREFEQKLVFITGGARGIGRATATEFARLGANVIVADIDAEAADVAAKQLREDHGVSAWAMRLDVSDPEAWETVAAHVVAEYGVPDVVMNNAGIGMGGPFLATSLDEWRRVIDINLWGVLHGCRIFAPIMAERGHGGHIVNVASAAAFQANRAMSGYSTTKAAVLMFTECLRAELETEGIGVTALCPGFVTTDIARSTIQVGVAPELEDEVRERAIAAYEKRNYPPEKVAAQVVKAVRENKPLAMVTPEAYAFRTISRVSTRLSRQVARLNLG